MSIERSILYGTVCLQPPGSPPQSAFPEPYIARCSEGLCVLLAVFGGYLGITNARKYAAREYWRGNCPITEVLPDTWRWISRVLRTTRLRSSRLECIVSTHACSQGLNTMLIQSALPIPPSIWPGIDFSCSRRDVGRTLSDAGISRIYVVPITGIFCDAIVSALLVQYPRGCVLAWCLFGILEHQRGSKMQRNLARHRILQE